MSVSFVQIGLMCFVGLLLRNKSTIDDSAPTNKMTITGRYREAIVFHLAVSNSQQADISFIEAETLLSAQFVVVHERIVFT